MTSVGTTPAQATTVAARLESTDTRAATTPAIVAGGTNGAARRLARTPTRLTEPCSSTTTGAVMTCAATGIAKAGPKARNRVGSRAPIASPHGLVNSSSPRVARVESANP